MFNQGQMYKYEYIRVPRNRIDTKKRNVFFWLLVETTKM